MNDPLQPIENAGRIKALEEAIATLKDCRVNFDCGCPESRLCRHPEIDGLAYAEEILSDLLEEEKKR